MRKDLLMLYAMLCYGSEAVTNSWTKQQEGESMAAIETAEKAFPASTTLGPALRLFPTTTATTLRAGAEPLVLDGPFAETKEQIGGFGILNVPDLQAAIDLISTWPGLAETIELRPVL